MPRPRGPARSALRDRVDAYGDEDAALPFCDGCGEKTIGKIISALEGGGDLIGAARFLDHLGRFDEAEAMMERARGMIGGKPDAEDGD